MHADPSSDPRAVQLLLWSIGEARRRRLASAPRGAPPTAPEPASIEPSERLAVVEGKAGLPPVGTVAEMSAAAVSPHPDDECFSVDWAMTDGHVLLRLQGELDLGTADRLGDATTRAYEQGVRTIVLDLSELRFIDSSGLHELVKAWKRQREIGGDVVLRRPTKQTLRVLELVGLTKVFTTER